MVIKPIQPHLKQLCKQLGSEYRIVLWDLEYVITRDLITDSPWRFPGSIAAARKSPLRFSCGICVMTASINMAIETAAILRPSLSSRRTSLPTEWNGYAMSPEPCWGLIHTA